MSRFRRRLMGLAALRQAKADDFVRVEYIENTSTAYINTGIKGNNNIKIDAVLLFNITAAQFVYGSRRGDTMTASGNYAYLFYTNGTSYFGTCVGRTVSQISDYIPETNKKYHLNGTMRNLNIIYNDIDEETGEEVEKTINITNSDSTPASANEKVSYIFNINSKSGISVNNGLKGRVYSFKIYSGSTLVRDYIPMYQISTDTYGLWDRVTEEFYTSPNGVKFTGGERVIADADDNIYYLRNYISTYNTARYLNTGIYANSTDYWETKVYLASGRNYAFGGWSANNSNMYGIHANANTISFVYGSGGINYSVSYANKIFTLKQTFDDETQTMHFYVYDSSGKLVWSNQIAKRGSAASKTFYIGNYNGSTYGSTNNTRFYYFKYYRNGELIRDFIPVQSCEDGIYGFFDKVNLRFYKSSGTAAFTGA